MKDKKPKKEAHQDIPVESTKTALPTGQAGEVKLQQPEAIPAAAGLPAGQAGDESSNPVDCLCQAIEQADKKLARKLEMELGHLKKLVKEREDYRQLLQRVQADFENYQKRVKRDREEWEKYQHEDVVKELLPALDSLDRSICLKCESDDAQSLLEGIKLTRREILRILEKQGLTIIKTQHEKFDPAFHEAVSTVESAEQPAGMVVEEVKTGFMLHDRVLRPAQVRVTVAPRKTEPNPDK